MAAITTECLLFRLACELRDKIYDLIFATEHKNATIEFPRARPLVPSANAIMRRVVTRYFSIVQICVLLEHAELLFVCVP